MGCSTSTPPRDQDEQHYYTAPQSTRNALNQPLSKAHGKLAHNGTVCVEKDKYEEAKQMISYPSYRNQQNMNIAENSFHSEASYATLCDKLELNFSLRNIPKLDLLSPSDPFIVVYLKDEIKNIYNIVGKTEIIWDNPHPDFSKDIRINYLFEEIQYIRLEMYDADQHQTTDLSKLIII